MKPARYKVLGYPPKKYSNKNKDIFPAENEKQADNLLYWYLNVEWGNLGASAEKVRITEEEYKELVK